MLRSKTLVKDESPKVSRWKEVTYRSGASRMFLWTASVQFAFSLQVLRQRYKTVNARNTKEAYNKVRGQKMIHKLRINERKRKFGENKIGSDGAERSLTSGQWVEKGDSLIELNIDWLLVTTIPQGQ